MSEIKAKLKFKQNHFEIIEEGNYVNCAVSEKNSFKRPKVLRM